jgi:hypothetical protein
MKHVFGFLLLIFFVLLFSNRANAQTSYMLPYPGAMPGSKVYIIDQVWERMMSVWHYGDFGRARFNRQQADKYLVEAKVLFEYGQYLLATQSLSRSDRYFRIIQPALEDAKRHGKDITEEKAIVVSATKKHVQVLEDLKRILPEEFVWTPENDQASQLLLHQLINDSIKQREQWYE